MSVIAVGNSIKSYCNIAAMQKGIDPAGSAGDFEDAIILEVPLPWKRQLYEKAGALPQEIIDLLDLWLQRYRDGLGYPHRLLLVAPDAAYSRPGFCRVMFYTKPSNHFAQYTKVEYLVPASEMGALAWSLYEATYNLEHFERYRAPDEDATRDLLVCTHGTIDAACAKFGYPLYQYLRKNHAYDELRVWRVSHFGGHIFAPTLMDMPIGHYWAYVEESQAAQIAGRCGDVEALHGHYRGWAGLTDGFAQAAERAMWQREGWSWFTYAKSGEFLSQDSSEENPTWAEIRIAFSQPDGEDGIYEARVETRTPIETFHTTGQDGLYRYPQYVVTDLIRVR